MKNLKAVTIALAMGFIGFGPVYAASPLAGVTGYDGTGATITGGDGPVQLAFTQVKDGGYQVTVNRVVAIFKVDPGIAAAVKQPDTYDTKTSVWILKDLPAGSKLYAMGLGTEWAGVGSDIGRIDLAKAKASGDIKGGAATLAFNRPADQKCRVVNWVVAFPDGKRAWGPNGNDKTLPYHVHVGGKPATAWCFEGNKIVTMGAATRTALAKQQ
ncbi:MAG: hypothetical protein A3J06_01715 [Candidatus Moranbacteria bacterium RIFCSPLOWO2_02_FULL_48_19]|nr:MAG: hypothetical protein A3J06_01715 [Candidatus Moranbacteria bacterium RIFCSPLOWO2_02_FULL_48_19]OGI30293.1 MAG: hypothetical protein A3G09_02135 [Candidatus Moranbacteria bacterium RIFCSPLOWO2_12_FULL_48_12]